MISKQIDEFLRDKEINTALWRALLNDGSWVIQDDDRPEYEIKPAWLRLKQYLALNPHLKIVRLDIGFRDNMLRHVVPDNAQGYYFAKSITASTTGWFANYYVVGWLENNIIHTKKFQVPEMLYDSSEERSIESCQLGLICSI